MKQNWYQDFVSDENLGCIDNGMLFELLLAANYMGIKELSDLGCLKTTFHLTDMSTEEIRELLRLPELTEAEEKKARTDFAWIFEDS